MLAVKADADGSLLEDLLAAAATEPDAEPVAVRLCGRREHTRLLRTGRPMPRVAALPTDHAFAGASRIRLADLGIGPEEVDGRAERDIGEQGVHDPVL